MTAKQLQQRCTHAPPVRRPTVHTSRDGGHRDTVTAACPQCGKVWWVASRELVED